MMGRTHATSGAVAFLLLVPPLRAMGVDLGGVGVGVGAVAAAGAAMIPDLDHPRASIARALGPVTGLLARITAKISGGHRHGTHSLIGLVITVALSVGVALVGGIAVGLELSFLAALASAAIQFKLTKSVVLHTVMCLIAGIVLTGLSIWHDIPVTVLPIAVGIGVAAHIAGDCLTEEGCPLLWPVRWRLSILPLRTEGVVERFVVGPGLAVVAAVLVWQLSDQTALTPFTEAFRARMSR